ncbi:MAG TPA: hypothetical protein VMI34_07545 [Candidatus Bathyarchaeia archaeon]|nr:hypothetical protein [Candidatus Bathyarchaeia archaeon]
MTRRRALGALAGLAAAGVALLAEWRAGLLTTLTEKLAPRPDSASLVGRLSGRALDNVVAFGESLVEGRVLSGAERMFLLEHVEYRAANTPGYRALYEVTSHRLDELTGRRFAALSIDDRIAVLSAHRLDAYNVRRREYLVPFGRRDLAIRSLVARDLVDGYYRSPAGWLAVGYSAFPGRCGELTRYTRAESS